MAVSKVVVVDGNNLIVRIDRGVAGRGVTDVQPVEIDNNYYYFLLDTASLIPNTYYLDVLATSNLEVTTLKNVCQFNIVNQVELRQGQ
jgi:hypothetical protein